MGPMQKKWTPEHKKWPPMLQKNSLANLWNIFYKNILESFVYKQ